MPLSYHADDVNVVVVISPYDIAEQFIEILREVAELEAKLQMFGGPGSELLAARLAQVRREVNECRRDFDQRGLL